MGAICILDPGDPAGQTIRILSFPPRSTATPASKANENSTTIDFDRVEVQTSHAKSTARKTEILRVSSSNINNAHNVGNDS